MRIPTLVLALLLALPAVAADSRAPLTLVFTDLRGSEWTPEVTRQITDCLIRSLEQTDVFGDVIVSSGSPTDGDLVLSGDLGKEGNAIVLHLSLTGMTDRRPIDQVSLTYNSRAQLLADCPKIAQRLATSAFRESAAATPDRRIETRVGLKVGQEGVSRGPSVPGGAYLYLDVTTEFGGMIGLAGRYALATLPFDFDSHLIGTALMLNFRLADSLSTGLGPVYLMSTDYESKPTHFLGVRVAPLHSGDLDDMSIEVFPFSVLFDLDSGDVLFTLELLSLGVWLPQ